MNPSSEKRTFVLDTNVLLHEHHALEAFAEHDVVIPFSVLGELDKFKKDSSDIGYHARQTIRFLDQLRERGCLSKGVSIGDGLGQLTVVFFKEALKACTDCGNSELPTWFHEDIPDNRIIGVAWALDRNRPGNVVLLSKDVNVRLKADALGVKAEDYENSKVDVEKLYRGYDEVNVPDDIIDRLFEERHIPIEELDIPQDIKDGMHPNSFLTLHSNLDPSHSALARALKDTGELMPISRSRRPVFGVVPRNMQQTMAMELLLDESVPLVTVIGGAGTGKTLLALATGMHKTMVENHYEKLLVARPVVPMGKDIGYLPGDKDEKLSAWMQPIFDNLSYLFSSRGGGDRDGAETADSLSVKTRINQLIKNGDLVLESLSYIRGRSIPHQYIIVDEAQNLTPHEVKTIISRAGEGTKIVLTGDIEQIDNPYLDVSSNGLSYAVERLKNSPMTAHITLAKSERSSLAQLASDLL